METFRRTFFNPPTVGEEKEKFLERALNCLDGTIEDMNIFMKDPEGTEETGPFYEYGLCFDYVEPDTFEDQTEGYYRFQLSWGGPSDEFRFYSDGSIEYVYLDWFTGIGWDVTGEDWAEFIRSMFEDL